MSSLSQYSTWLRGQGSDCEKSTFIQLMMVDDLICGENILVQNGSDYDSSIYETWYTEIVTLLVENAFRYFTAATVRLEFSFTIFDHHWLFKSRIILQLSWIDVALWRRKNSYGGKGWIEQDEGEGCSAECKQQYCNTKSTSVSMSLRIVYELYFDLIQNGFNSIHSHLFSRSPGSTGL